MQVNLSFSSFVLGTEGRPASHQRSGDTGGDEDLRCHHQHVPPDPRQLPEDDRTADQPHAQGIG